MKNKIIRILGNNPAGLMTNQILTNLVCSCAHPDDAPSRGTVAKCLTRMVRKSEIHFQRIDGSVYYKLPTVAAATSESVASAAVPANP